MAAPKITPVPQSGWTAEQRALAAAFPKGPTGNALGTFLTSPELVRGIYPFASYIMADSTLTPRQRELLVLRMAWDCSSQYLWAHHAPRAAAAGISAGELRGIALGPDAPGWGPFEAALLRAADELHRDTFISTPTWNTLATQFGTEQLMDATFTVGESAEFATIYNSVGVEPEAGFAARFPADAPRPAMGPRGHKALTTARISPIDQTQLSPAALKIFDPTGAGRPIISLYRTFARHTPMAGPRQLQSNHINAKTTLSPREKDMTIVRISWLTGGDYPWAEHVVGVRREGGTEEEIRRLSSPGNAGWSAKEGALVRAIDEIYAADKISDETWKALTANYNDSQILDLLVAATGYRMTAMVSNSFGVQLQDGMERMPGSTLP
jgi:alkylhydroperoxidase family enzyme